MKTTITVGMIDYTVKLPIRVRSEANTHEHHMVKAKRVKQQRTAAHMHVKAFAGLTLLVAGSGPIYITLTRLMGKGQKSFDGDNLQSAFKAIRDGIADGLGINDRSPRLHWFYTQERAADFGIRIEIKAGGTHV